MGQNDYIDYSVIIRTTGNAHEKYQRLLDAISQLVPRPKELIVVLPEGYTIPDERLGWETFLFSPKGMVSQRMAGVAACKTEYALFCDDDVVFPSDFVSKLHAPLAGRQACFSAGPLFSFLPEPGKETIVCILMASALPTIFHRRTRYVSVLKSTGYSYNRHIDTTSTRYYETQSVPWTCFYAHVPSFRALDFEKETWLDAHGYSDRDDQTMFYKAWLMGMKTVVVSNAEYVHLDAKTSTMNNKSSAVYSMAFNRVVFMHRFLYSQQGPFGKLAVAVAFTYYCAWALLRNVISVFRHRMTRENCRLSLRGFREGLEYLCSVEYRNLPPIMRRQGS